MTNIQKIKEEVLEEFGSYGSREIFKDFLSQSLDHIASVARQEGREEAITIGTNALLRMQMIAIELATREKDDGAIRLIYEIGDKYLELLAKLTGKEEEV